MKRMFKLCIGSAEDRQYFFNCADHNNKRRMIFFFHTLKEDGFAHNYGCWVDSGEVIPEIRFKVKENKVLS